MENISSLNNIKIKNLLRLQQKNRERKNQGLFVIDGLREIREARHGGIALPEIFVCPEFIKNNKILEEFDQSRIIAVSEAVYRKICYKEKPDGFLAMAKIHQRLLTDLPISHNSLFIVLERVEKPGNLGAIIRSAYAASCDGLIVTDEQTDVYHPNVIRASEGFVFRLPIAVANNRDTIDFLKKQKIKIMAAALKGAKSYTQADFTKAIALVLGTESTGLSQEWLEAAAEIIKIPMKSDIDSLNVSVSAAILMFEAQRQRSII